MSAIHTRAELVTDAKVYVPQPPKFLPEPDAPEVPPPRDYGYGDGSTWAPEDDSFYVPAVLRRYYADPVAEPTEVETRGYIEYGYQTNEVRELEDVRGLGVTDDGRGAVVRDTRRVNVLVDRSGPAHYPEWLHDTRLRKAITAKGTRDIWVTIEARRPPRPRCVVCGAPDPAHGVGGLSQGACRTCWPLLDAALADELAARILPDGRTMGDAAREAAARILDAEGVRR